MSIILRALSAPDASGFVELEGKLRLIRPPFKLSFSPEVSRDDLADAINRIGYQPCEQTFKNLGAVIDFIRAEHRAWVEKRGLSVPEETSAEDLVSDASGETARRILGLIESRILPSRDTNAAANLLAALIKEFPNDREIQAWSARLLAQATNITRHLSEKTDRQRDLRFRTPDDGSEILKISHAVRDRHSLLALGC